MDYKKLTDQGLAKVMIDFIDRVSNLKNSIKMYLDGTDRNIASEQYIKEEYAQLKKELREAANYLYLKRNRDERPIYIGAFSPSIREASAFGFQVSINHRIDYEMFTAVSEAKYKLTKYKSLKEWENIL